MSFDEKAYNREYMRRKRAERRWQKEIDRGHCPVCGMLLNSTYHFSCRYLDTLPNETPPDN